jgi:hypothetical protein
MRKAPRHAFEREWNGRWLIGPRYNLVRCLAESALRQQRHTRHGAAQQNIPTLHLLPPQTLLIDGDETDWSIWIASLIPTCDGVRVGAFDSSRHQKSAQETISVHCFLA